MPRTWFKLDGAKGDRTFEQQLIGLEQLWPWVKGASVLDVGCAEGLIAIECERQGAENVLGVELRGDAVKRANELARNRTASFLQADANVFTVAPLSFDVVLMLAILHKLRDPSAAFERYLRAARQLAVVRLPNDDWPVLRDARSGNRPHDLAAVAARAGFDMTGWAQGPVADGNPPEFVGYLTRIA